MLVIPHNVWRQFRLGLIRSGIPSMLHLELPIMLDFRPLPHEPVPALRLQGGALLQPPLRGDQHDGHPQPDVRGIPQGCQLYVSQVWNWRTAHEYVILHRPYPLE